jgi:hypothetical protein
MNQAMLDLGHPAPFGLCTACESRALKLRAMVLPRAIATPTHHSSRLRTETGKSTVPTG